MSDPEITILDANRLRITTGGGTADLHVRDAERAAAVARQSVALRKRALAIGYGDERWISISVTGVPAEEVRDAIAYPFAVFDLSTEGGVVIVGWDEETPTFRIVNLLSDITRTLVAARILPERERRAVLGDL